MTWTDVDPIRPQGTDDEPWVSLETNPGFVAAMGRARAEHERGEFRPFRHRPAPDPLTRHRSRDVALVCLAGLVILVLLWVALR